MDRARSGNQAQLSEWVERVAMFCADEYGVPPIAGRVLGWLMICDPPEQSAAQIAEAIGARFRSPYAQNRTSPNSETAARMLHLELREAVRAPLLRTNTVVDEE